MSHSDERGVTRRAMLTGAAGAMALLAGGGWLVEEDMLPGRSRAYGLLGLNGDGAPMPDAEPGPHLTGSFTSRARGGAEVGWSVSYPPGHQPGAALPVLLVLHGASGDHTSPAASLGMDRFLAIACSKGLAPFALAAADGGRSYWSPQPDGTDASRMIVEEFLPLLQRHGLDTAALALTGWSMGGYGALRLAGASVLPVRAVTVLSPALAPEDGVTDHPERLNGVPLRVDCGRGDPFYNNVRDFLDALDPAPVARFGAGGHTPAYWRTAVPAQLEFVGSHLAPA